jgi:hypothetical protein
MIYTFGDSHCCFPWGEFENQQYKVKIPNAIVPVDHTNGVPQTMYKFGLSRMILVDKIPKDDIACFCFGEIDCRYHIHKYQPWKETIENIVKEYLNTIRENAKINSNIWIFNVVHPIKDSERENVWYGSPERKIPFIGSDYERLLYAKYMNKLLRENLEVVFVDIMDKYCDKDGFLIKELSDGGVHIANERYLVEWINRREFVK